MAVWFPEGRGGRENVSRYHSRFRRLPLPASLRETSSMSSRPFALPGRRQLSSCAFIAAAFTLAVSLTGCADPGVIEPQVTGLAVGGATTAYALQTGATPAVLSFSLAGSGSAAPASTLSLAPNFEPSALAVDRTSGTIYVGGIVHGNSGSTAQIQAFTAGAAGAATPVRTITPASASFDQPQSMTVDNSGQLYVASVVGQTPTITVFGASANAAAAPVRTLGGGSTGIYLPSAITVDAAGNLYVASIDPVVTPYGGSIIEFAPNLQGNTPPTRSITSINTIFNGVGVDSAGNIWAVQETDNNGVFSSPAIVEFSSTASGAVSPIRSITGAATLLGTVGELQVDGGNNVYVVEQSPSGADALLGFGPSAKGNAPPDLALTPPALTTGAAQFAIR